MAVAAEPGLAVLAVVVGLFELEVGAGGVEEQQVHVQLEQVGDGEEHRLLQLAQAVERKVHRPVARRVVDALKPLDVGLLAHGPPQRAEFLSFFLGALRVAAPGVAGPPLHCPPLSFQVADADVLHHKLSQAGLAEVRVETVVWKHAFRSATHLWDAATNGNPIGATLVADLTEQQTADARHVLDGMLRERSGGTPDAVLHIDVNIAVGTV